MPPTHPPPGGAKFFVGGLSRSTTDETLAEYFRQFGETLDTIVIKKNNISRGFGFVVFSNEQCLRETDFYTRQHTIDDTPVDVKEAVPEGKVPSHPTTPVTHGTQRGNRLFVGGLSSSTTKETLEAHFSQFGTIVDALLPRDPDTQKSRGFGFVAFQTDEEANTVCAHSTHTVDGKMVEVKKALPKPATTGNGTNNGTAGGNGGGYDATLAQPPPTALARHVHHHHNIVDHPAAHLPHPHNQHHHHTAPHPHRDYPQDGPPMELVDLVELGHPQVFGRAPHHPPYSPPIPPPNDGWLAHGPGSYSLDGVPPSPDQPHTLAVHNLPPTVTEQTLCAYFGQWDTVIAAEIFPTDEPIDSVSAMVTLASQVQAMRVLEYGMHVIDQHPINIVFADEAAHFAPYNGYDNNFGQQYDGLAGQHGASHHHDFQAHPRGPPPPPHAFEYPPHNYNTGYYSAHAHAHSHAHIPHTHPHSHVHMHHHHHHHHTPFPYPANQQHRTDPAAFHPGRYPPPPAMHSQNNGQKAPPSPQDDNNHPAPKREPTSEAG